MIAISARSPFLMHETASAGLRGHYRRTRNAYGEVKKIQACLRRNRTTTSMRAIS
jgi:hypothetical protein